MKKRTIIVSIAALVIISFAAPYFAPDEVERYIGNASTLISLFSTLLTLALAMILYNQMGLDQTLLQKKAEVVLKLLELLNDRGFKMKTNLGYTIYISLSSISRHKKDYEKFAYYKLLFNKEYPEYIRPIIELEKNIFLPKELFYKILRLEPNAFYPTMDLITHAEYVQVGIKIREPLLVDPLPDVPVNQWGQLMFISANKTLINEITLKEFIDHWDDLIISSVQWINKFSSYQELNIPFFRDYYKDRD
jgi:hypothetical protein